MLFRSGAGLGPLVRPGNFFQLREANFGQTLLNEQAGTGWIKSEISCLRRREVFEVATLIRRHSNLETLVDYMLDEYGLIGAMGTQASLPHRQAIAHSLQIQKQSIEQSLMARPSHSGELMWIGLNRFRMALASLKALLKTFMAGAV